MGVSADLIIRLLKDENPNPVLTIRVYEDTESGGYYAEAIEGRLARYGQGQTVNAALRDLSDSFDGVAFGDPEFV